MADSGMESEEESWTEAWDDVGQSSTHPSVGKNNSENGNGFTNEGRDNKTSNKAITAVATTTTQQSSGIDRISGSGVGGNASANVSNESGRRETEVKKSGTTSGGIMSRMALNDNKAGMEGLDRDKINAIIYEASKGK